MYLSNSEGRRMAKALWQKSLRVLWRTDRHTSGSGGFKAKVEKGDGFWFVVYALFFLWLILG
jgi:hypothetical protein